MGFPRLSVSDDDSDKQKTSTDETATKVHDVIKGFAVRTSMHGCGYIHTSCHWFSKAAWALITLFAIVCLVIHLYTIIYDFLQWPKATKVSLSFNNLQFPAITICNSNPIRKSKLSEIESEYLQELISSVDPDSYDFLDTSDVTRGFKRAAKDRPNVITVL